MQTNFFKKLLFLSVLTIVFSCAKELDYSSENETIDFNKLSVAELNEIKSWYSSSQGDIIDLDVLGSNSVEGKTQKLKVLPLWKHSISYKINETTSIIESPLRSDIRFGFASVDEMKKAEESGNDKYRRSLTRLLIAQSDDGTKEGIVMTLMGDVDYLEASDFGLWRNTFIRKEKDFKGTVLFHFLDGSFSHGYKMEGNKVIKKITTELTKSKGDKQLSSRSSNCTDYDVYLITEQCTDWYNYAEGGDEVYISYNGSSCGYSTEYSHSYTECTVESGELSTGGGSSGGYYGNSSNNEWSVNSQLIPNGHVAQWQIPKPHCSSFHYYKPPGSNIQAAAVTGIGVTFAASYSDGYGGTILHFQTVASAMPIYYIAPGWMYPGVASTLTAQAMETAIDATQAAFSANPRWTEQQLTNEYKLNLGAAMKAYLGVDAAVSPIPPFPMRNAEPYQTSIFTTGNCN